VDVGCGTGNAALLAAARGARVTGVDPASRLLDVARAQAAARGLDATFVSGDAATLPLADGEADLLLSVFGVIFAPDPRAAAAEMARVAAPGGRIVISAWIPEGAISDVVRAAREAVRRALGGRGGPPPFAWHDLAELTGLLSPHGFEVSMTEARLAFTASSPSDYVRAEFENHPLRLAALQILEPRGEAQALREHELKVLAAANEDPTGFRVTSRYVVASAHRG
jgi:SAM-dependent methyltransferase